MRRSLLILGVLAAFVAAPLAWRWIKRSLGALVVILLAGCGPAHLETDASIGEAHLVLRVAPTMHLAPVELFLVAELVGGEPTEALYCPNVVWTWPDQTESGEEGDCPPWDKREDFQRFWRPGRRLMVGQGTTGHFAFDVRLEKPAGHVLLTAPPVDFWAPGDVGTLIVGGRAFSVARQ